MRGSVVSAHSVSPQHADPVAPEVAPAVGQAAPSVGEIGRIASQLALFAGRDRPGAAASPDNVASALAAAGVPALPAAAVAPRRPWQRSYVGHLLVADAACATAGSLLAAALFGTLSLGRDIVFVPAYVAAWLVALAAGRTYETRCLGVGSMEHGRVLRSGVAVFAIVSLADVLLGLRMGRPAALAIAATIIFDLVARLLLRRHLHRARWRGLSTDRVIAVGTRAAVSHVIATLRLEVHHGLDVVGVCLTDTELAAPGRRTSPEDRSATGARGDPAAEVLGVPVLGGLADVPAAVVAAGARVVAVAGGADLASGGMRRLAWSLESLGTELLVSPGLVEVAGTRLTVRPYPTLPLLHVEQPRLSGGARIVKGLGDRFAAGVFIVVLAPVFLAVSAVVATTSPGPVFFRQTRIGLDGKPFQVWKFRSMVVDPPDLAAILQARLERDGVLFKMRRDPRVTRVGKTLRRLSIDELPQLFNVFLGSMSLVGPRPPLPSEVAHYGLDMRRRLLVKPGMTGLWQVSGRSDLSWEDTVRLDLRYVENWNVGLDISILWHTVHAVVTGRGAY